MEQPEQDIDKLMESIEEDSVRKQLLSLVVSDWKRGIGLERLMDLFIYKIKKEIYKKIQEAQDLELNEINKLLIKFVSITV